MEEQLILSVMDAVAGARVPAAADKIGRVLAAHSGASARSRTCHPMCAGIISHYRPWA